MSPEKLVHMANQIALFMESKPQAQAVEGIAGHINDFWEPRMRRQFFAMIDAGEGTFRPLVREAAGKVRRPAEA
jgi:formate dehydrogenase subunit delta